MKQYTTLHFQDLVCGVYSPRPLSADHRAAFDALCRDFSYVEGARTLRKYEGPNYLVCTTSPIEDIDHSGTDFACFAGYATGLTSARSGKRGLASHFLRAGTWDHRLVGRFLDSRFSGVVIGKNFCRLVVDYYGKKKFFYKQAGGAIFFSNEFRNLCHLPGPPDPVDRQALRDLLTFGAIIGDATLSSAIKAIPLQGYVHFDEKGLELKIWPGDESGERGLREPSPEETYAHFQRVFRYFHEELGLRNSDITGGTDTRLNLATARRLGISFPYDFDSHQSASDPAAFFDHAVVKRLQEKYSLEVHEDIAGPYRSNLKLAKTKFDNHRQFEGDMFSHTFSGMFGGEFFGGWSYENFHGPVHSAEYEEMEEELRARAGVAFWQGTIPSRDNFAQWTKGLRFADAPFFASLYLTYASAAFYRVGNPIWFEPYYLSNRKLSCFLADEIFRCLDLPEVNRHIGGYSFYGKLFAKCLPEYLEVPFFSQVTKALPDPNLDIRNHAVYHGPQPSAPAAESRQNRLDQKLALLTSWSQQAGFRGKPSWLDWPHRPAGESRVWAPAVPRGATHG